MTRQRLKDILRWSSMLLLLVGLLGGRLGEILYALPLGIFLLICGWEEYQAGEKKYAALYGATGILLLALMVKKWIF